MRFWTWIRRSRMRQATLITCTLLVVLVGGISAAIFPRYPWHASCKIKYTFGKDCGKVSDALANQMTKWEGSDCGTGQKCLYSLISANETYVSGTHTTPARHYTDDLSFTLTPTSTGCDVEAYSTSQVFYAILDMGTNYCNLHNLVEGAGLQENDAHFSESTGNSICTQFTSADCEKY